LAKNIQASVRVDELTFSDGKALAFGSSKLVLIVGPNNAGKSASLREIESRIRSGTATNVVVDAKITKLGSSEEIGAFIEAEFQFDDSRGKRLYTFVGGQIWSQALAGMWRGFLAELTSLFVNRMATDDRLSDCNPVSAVDFRRQVASKSIHAMQRSDALESAVSAEFKKAFDLRLYVDRFGGGKVGLRVGGEVAVLPGEDRISDAYGKRFEAQTKPLEQQGDGMRAFATVVSGVLAFETASIVLIDEPEAFLHPPQARLIGEFLASRIPDGRQVFVATHSPDLLMGAMSRTPDDALVIRIERQGDVNHVCRLDNKLAKEISIDPILMHSQVLDGVFHERVFVCEADADSMFYRAVLRAVVLEEEKNPDVHFCQSGGKSRMPSILTALRGLSVHADAIVDIDALNDADFFRTLVEAVGGAWETIEGDYKQVFDSIEAQRGVTKVRDLRHFFAERVENLDADARLDASLRAGFNKIFAEASPWGLAKKSGVKILPNGEPQLAFTRLTAKCSQFGIWLVEVGELERFCPSIGGHGPSWAQAVLSTKDPRSEPELEGARQFVKRIWQSRRPRSDA
jgi:hypothetical protein